MIIVATAPSSAMFWWKFCFVVLVACAFSFRSSNCLEDGKENANANAKAKAKATLIGGNSDGIGIYNKGKVDADTKNNNVVEGLVRSTISNTNTNTNTNTNNFHDDHHHHRMSMSNMTCGFFRQPLNHFVPRGRSPTYEERYCTYDGYANANVVHQNNTNVVVDEKSPIFFYTGNESPLEQYINQTGLMWELAPKFGARIVFVEHRYEGKSLPNNISEDCLSYASTIQALADYARIIEEKFNPGNVAPVVVFGGSYGGMLSAWMRMKYPHLVAGAIAASAPIGAFPQSADSKIDFSARVLANGLDQPYPPTAKQGRQLQEEELPQQRPRRRLQGATGTTTSFSSKVENDEQKHDKTNEIESSNNHCRDNLLAAWPLISWLARQDDDDDSANLLQKSFSMCDPLPDNNAEPLLQWAQRVWFDLAEGSFPYPSSYVPFALLHKKVDLPSWPTQDACWKSSQLHKDWGVQFHGTREDVRYRIDYGDSGISLDVDWDSVELAVVENKDYYFSSIKTTNTSSSISSVIEKSMDVIGLLTSVRDAVSIWYNITKDVTCYNISQAAPNARMMTRKKPLSSSLSSLSLSSLSAARRGNNFYDSFSRTEVLSKFDPAEMCHKAMIEQGSWGPICCNDEMNLVITEAQGMGHDFFWPPSHPKNVRTYKDMIRNMTFESCSDPYGIYGYSKEPYEPLSTWLDTYYGGITMNGHSNIVFSNGLLDPWSAGGVYKDDNAFSKNNDFFSHESFESDKAKVQNITENDVIALIIPFGGHHTDLMYSSEFDPDCVTEGRKIEEEFIARWIRNW